jgi:hypothetical protein
MKAVVVVVVVALGLVIGFWWTRDTTAPKAPAIAKPKPTLETRASETRARLTTRFPGLRPTQVKTLEPVETDPEIRPQQEALWRELLAFAKDTKLTDEQWERLQRDLSELAATESAAWAQGLRTDFNGIIELSDELEAELLQRCAAYMTRDQLLELRFRFLGVVTRVRQLHYLPRAEG